jgi:predicted transcriptional regulator of viral defense system
MRNFSTTRTEAIGWSFFTNHAHVLICLAEDPEMRLRDVGALVGITERAVQKIISELEAGGVIARERIGRRNVYQIHGEKPLRHPVESHCTVQGLTDFILHSKKRPPAGEPEVH